MLVDAEASPEHLSRATVEAADLQLVVAEPYFKSLETARRYSKLGKELGIPNVVVVANKVRTQADEDAIAEFCEQRDMELFAIIPFDATLGRAERAGVAPLEFDPSSDVVKAVEEIAEKMIGRVNASSA